MPEESHHFWEALLQREQQGTLRVLREKTEGIDFYSNDYLGLARSKEFSEILLQKVTENPQLLSGSTGSRLISGNSPVVTETEEYIARKHRFPTALLFPSGYNANLALFSTLPDRHDTIVVDEQIHRSVHDACRMSNARKVKFRHNDTDHLETLLKKHEGRCYVAVESLYSMEGDVAPLREISELSRKYGAHLVVDEAHSFGVFGYGMVDAYELQDYVTAVVVTYGKALGAHGAAILCSDTVKAYLVNFASPFIYTTSAQDYQWMAIQMGYDYLEAQSGLAEKLQQNIKTFRNQNIKTPSSPESPVQAVVIPDNRKLKMVQEALTREGILTYAIYSPTVKQGTERLRVCLHSFNTDKEIIQLTDIIKEFI
ncbi:aminotransferase class I/II-fold pyridoxal phosphate-dependent enzyme [Chryseobacterium pennipullorum]|uniref:Pyridoxal phosphate-dependent aminotransferase family protein n=1 Tax=Chryseobacterium pennipullorum TaxID=2258963 RepID=A0A3D9AVD4_9FLAO|nr:aminotransferase class I/II-fold pyridoxal phosphate-dependent enzyme [Chryseobacterium pennipullorum]REC45318.1 pyridoxal phosphate-dependent aminotransferase family protein [Chryseobacterium pennipullorum]